MYKMEFNFSKLVKSIVFRCLRTNKTDNQENKMAAQSTAQALQNPQDKEAFVKENEKNEKTK